MDNGSSNLLVKPFLDLRNTYLLGIALVIAYIKRSSGIQTQRFYYKGSTVFVGIAKDTTINGKKYREVVELYFSKYPQHYNCWVVNSKSRYVSNPYLKI